MLKERKKTNNYIFVYMIPFSRVKRWLKMGVTRMGFIFCLRFRRHFFRHTDFLRFKILKKIFFLNLDFGYHGKMYRLVSCIPILRRFFY